MLAPIIRVNSHDIERLDMTFDEDHSRARAEYAAENLAILRHFALVAAGDLRGMTAERIPTHGAESVYARHFRNERAPPS